jgi:hypothetical protein
MGGTETQRPRPPRGRWGSLLSGVISIVVLAFLCRSLARSWGTLDGVSWRLDPARLLLSLVVLAVYYPLLVWNWTFLMRALGEPVPFRRALPVWLGSQLGKFLPGKVWTLFGRAYLGERAGLDPVRVSFSLLIEVGLILVTGLLLVVVTMPLAADLSIPARGVLLLLLAPSLAAIHPAAFAALANIGLRLLRRGEARYTCTVREHLLLVGSFLLSWLLYGTAFYLFATSLSSSAAVGPLATWSGFLSVLCLHTASWIVGFVAFLTPGGLGVREASLSYLLAGMMPAGAATLVALLARLWITLAELLAIAIAWRVGRARAR